MEKNCQAKDVKRGGTLVEGLWTKKIKARPLGEEESTRDALVKIRKLIRLRIQRANIVILFCLPCGIACFIISGLKLKGEAVIFRYLMFAFAMIGFAAIFALAYRNFSTVVFKLLVFQINVCLIVIYATCNFLIDIVTPHSESSYANGLFYFGITLVYLFFDCIEIKSRKVVMFFGIFFTVLSLYNLYENSFGDIDIGVALITISGNIITKRAIKSFLFMSISLLAWRGFWILLRDTKMKNFIFIYANSLAIKIDPITGVQKTIRTDISVTKTLQLRVKIAGWALLASSLIGIPAYISNNIFFKGESTVLFTISLACSTIVVISLLVHGFRNLSCIALKDLVMRPSLIFLFLLCLLNWTIDCMYPFNSFSPINGCLFFIATFAVVSLDLMQEKDRKVVILMASMLFVLSLVNIINNTVVVSADGKKQIEIFGRTFTKANIKRTIFKQVLTLVLRGLYTLCRDKKMKYLAFSQKRMNRITGTSQKDHMRISYHKAREAELSGRQGIEQSNAANGASENTVKASCQNNVVVTEEQEGCLPSRDLIINPLAS